MPGCFVHLCTVKTVIWQICLNRPGKKVPQSARLKGGCNLFLGNAQIEVTLISVGLPLRTYQLTWVGARDTCVSKNIQRLYFSDFGYCCRIYPRLELGNEPSMLLPSDSDSPGWVKDEYSESIFYVQFCFLIFMRRWNEILARV